VIDRTDKFIELFSGSTVAYGQWDPRADPPAKTKHGTPTKNDYERHLTGDVGIGIIPVNGEGFCTFAAIDIDVDTIDHLQLLILVTTLGLPLNVCRSKSGGAHCYLFTKQGLKAEHLITTLSHWAELLGYPRAEIFPKQRRSTPDNVGNWINLPYFGSDTTTRYRVGPAGAQTLSEFLGTAIFFDPNQKIEVRKPVSQMPPCLQHLQEEGIGVGMRNQAILNYAVFYRKANPDDWQAKVKEQNKQYFTPPLELREVEGVITSVARTKYQYTCDMEPIRSYCNRPVCATLEFGVGHMPWQESGQLDDLDVKNCRKLLTDPPQYILNVNGQDIKLDWEEFYQFGTFKSKIGQVLNVIVATRKQASWETTVRTLLNNRVDLTAPKDASLIGLVIEKLHEFLTLRERATDREDLLRGLPVEHGNFVLFRMSDLRRYLQGYKLDRIDGPKLFLTLKEHGVEDRRIRINGKVIFAWGYPLKQLTDSEQTEDFKVQDFEEKLKPEV
jgi:hypothetical protein